MKYVETGSGYSHSVGYTYDELNNLTALAETINGTTRTTSYTYDDDNRVTSVPMSLVLMHVCIKKSGAEAPLSYFGLRFTW